MIRWVDSFGCWFVELDLVGLLFVSLLCDCFDFVICAYGCVSLF